MRVAVQWLQANWFKVSVVAILLFGAASAGWFFHVRQETMRKSIQLAEERQREESKIAALRRQQERELAERRAEEEKEQREREYAAKRRMECYQIYDKERSKWSNVEGPEYDLAEDICRIRYKQTKPVNKKDCDNLKDLDDALFRRMYYDCITGTFTSEF